MHHQQYDGLWPVMITPFTAEGDIDYASLERLIDWYERHGAAGLFAACQSSEIFFLSLKEREELVRFVKGHAHVPVIASGHVSENVWAQIDELNCMHRAGADALIMITNRLCLPGQAGESFLPRLKMMMDHIDPEVPLGFYECPYPFKRLITLDELRWCAESGRFAFMKDTCCDIELIRARLRAIEGSSLSLFNANTTTFLDSLRAGAAGFSGVMMNFHMELYRWLWQNWREQPEKAEQVQAFLTVFSEIERQYYPVNAKYHLKEIEGVLDSAFARVKPESGLTETFRDEVRQLHLAARLVQDTLCQG